LSRVQRTLQHHCPISNDHHPWVLGVQFQQTKT
jgi:hypothetical protein